MLPRDLLRMPLVGIVLSGLRWRI